MRQPRWSMVRYGWGFQKEGDPGTDTLPNMMADYEKYIGDLEDRIEKLKVTMRRAGVVDLTTWAGGPL